MLAKLPWDQFRNVWLFGFPIKIEELRQLIEKVSGKINLGLDTIYLLDGTWEEVLEILRGKVDCYSRVVNPRGTQLATMSASEAREFKREFDSEDFGGWFSDERCPGPASFYIRGGNIPNPLSSVEDSSDDT